MVAQAIEELPNECCGLLAGPIVPGLPEQTVVERFPLVNADSSPREYTSEPKSLFTAHRSMRENGWDILAVYHSHPTTDPVPSRKDLERNFHGSEVVHIIISLKDDVPCILGWRLRERDYSEVELTVY
jgi:proteasome lid subunit RPN8/RPN11